jgi:hypothetical protein
MSWRKGLALGAVLATSGTLLAGAVSEASAAYPQTRPSAGQYCKAIHVGVVTKAANGRLVKCAPDGSRNRWRYVRR